LEVDFNVSIPRGAGRGYGDPDPAAASNRRYVEGQRLYLATCRPQERATWVIDNNVLADAYLTNEPRN
jgi:uridine kinase